MPPTPATSFEQGRVVGLELRAAGPVQGGVVLPPADAHLQSPIDGGDDEADADGEQFHAHKAHRNIAGDDDPLVEDPLKDIGKSGAADAVLQGHGGSLSGSARR